MYEKSFIWFRRGWLNRLDTFKIAFDETCFVTSLHAENIAVKIRSNSVISLLKQFSLVTFLVRLLRHFLSRVDG